LALPPVGVAEGTKRFLLAADFVGAAAFLLAFAYKERPPESIPGESPRIGRPTMLLVTIAGLSWGLFNTAIAMIFSFGFNECAWNKGGLRRADR
jgi:hypothetical protein